MIGIITIVKDEHDYLKEFIDYHKKIGVTSFYLYDNKPTSTKQKNCNFINFQKDLTIKDVYKHFTEELMQNAKEDWFLFIDVNEFICPIKHKTISKFIKEYSDLKCINIRTNLFPASYHVKKPEGSILRNYILSKPIDNLKLMFHKSINENDTINIIDDRDIIRINKYSRSWEEYISKLKINNSLNTIIYKFNNLFSYDCIEDTEILKLIKEDPIKNNISGEVTQLVNLLDDITVGEIIDNVQNNILHKKFYYKLLTNYSINNIVALDQVKFLTQLLRINNINKVLEYEFNDGLITSIILGSKASLNVFTLDSKENSDTKALIDIFYPNRHVFIKDNKVINDEVDLVILNRKQNNRTIDDINSALDILKSNGMIIINDLNNDNIINDWSSLVESRKIRQIDIFKNDITSWAVGYKSIN